MPDDPPTQCDKCVHWTGPRVGFQEQCDVTGRFVFFDDRCEKFERYVPKGRRQKKEEGDNNG